jgi:hypothetical protein
MDRCILHFPKSVTNTPYYTARALFAHGPLATTPSGLRGSKSLKFARDGWTDGRNGSPKPTGHL